MALIGGPIVRGWEPLRGVDVSHYGRPDSL